jgi:isoleucyl-tRNA synthetase
LEENCPFRKDFTANETYISTEVLSGKIEFVNSLSIFDEIEIDEVRFGVGIRRL